MCIPPCFNSVSVALNNTNMSLLTWPLECDKFLNHWFEITMCKCCVVVITLAATVIELQKLFARNEVYITVLLVVDPCRLSHNNVMLMFSLE